MSRTTVAKAKRASSTPKPNGHNSEKNSDLRDAIFQSGQKQREIALLAEIPEGRVSQFIHGRAEATREERQRLSRVLNRPISELFP